MTSPSPTRTATPSRAERLLAQFHEEAQVASQKVDLQLLRALWPFARPHLWLYLAALALIPVGTITALWQPRLLQQAVNVVGVGLSGEPLQWIALQYAMLIALRFAAGAVETYTMQLAGQRTLAALRLSVFAHLQRLSIRYFDRTPVGRIVTRVTNDIDSMSELFASGAVSGVADLFLLIGIVVAMLSLDVKLSLIAFAVLPPLVLIVEGFRRVLRAAQRRIRARTAQLNAFLNEQVQGMPVVQAFSREAECQAAYAEINGDYRAAYRRSIGTDALMFSTVEAISSICVGLVLWYAAGRLVTASGIGVELQKGTFIAFYAYIQQFFIPVRDLSSKYTVIQSAFASAERVFGLLSIQEWDAPSPGAPDAASEPPAAAASGHASVGALAPPIGFDNVSFRYKDNGPPVLDGLSFQVGRGETVALVGATGAGKSTIAALIMRLYDVSAGAVLVDGHDVRSYPREALRRRFAVVPQDVFLFAGDLFSNIAFGDPRPDRARAAEALARVGASRVFEARGGLAMAVDERGSNLSAGERQLIAFARALYREAEILILDEATANIDSHTEARLSAAVEELLKDRTSVVIAHRLSTIRRADRIFVLHRGQLVEQGTHSELLMRGGVYARLYYLQFASPTQGRQGPAPALGSRASGR